MNEWRHLATMHGDRAAALEATAAVYMQQYYPPTEYRGGVLAQSLDRGSIPSWALLRSNLTHVIYTKANRGQLSLPSLRGR